MRTSLCGSLRLQEAYTGRLQPPLTDCMRADIMAVSPLCGKPDFHVLKAMQERHPKCEFIYDRSTGQNGWHVYFRVRGTMTPTPGDLLRYLFSCQENTNLEWGKSPFRAPGLWVLEELDKRSKKRFGTGDVEKDSQKDIEEMHDRNRAIMAEQDQLEVDRKASFIENIHPYVVKGKIPTAPKFDRRKKKGKAAQAAGV